MNKEKSFIPDNQVTDIDWNSDISEDVKSFAKFWCNVTDYILKSNAKKKNEKNR